MQKDATCLKLTEKRAFSGRMQLYWKLIKLLKDSKEKNILGNNTTNPDGKNQGRGKLQKGHPDTIRRGKLKKGHRPPCS